MTKSFRVAVVTTLLGAAVVSCAAGGYKSPGAHDLPSNGAGPFRLLTSSEIAGGRAVTTSGLVESAMGVRIDEDSVMLTFAHAATGTRENTDTDSPWLAGFAPRKIRRSTISEGPSFDEAGEVLVAAEAWEGGEVFDPWMVKLPDNSYRLYYAAAGGIGLANGDAPDGTFTRAAGAPVLDVEDTPFGSAAPRHPSVIHDGTRFIMYFQAGDAIGVAFSDDGVTWSDTHEVTLGLELPPTTTTTVTHFAAPCAIWRTPEVGEPFVHVMVEALYANGTRGLVIAGSYDHQSFESAVVPPLGRTKNPGAPALLSWEEGRISILYFSVDEMIGGVPGRNVYVAVSPGDYRFTLPEETTP